MKVWNTLWKQRSHQRGPAALLPGFNPAGAWPGGLFPSLPGLQSCCVCTWRKVQLDSYLPFCVLAVDALH